MEIREAVPDDNDALIELQAKCPQGTDLITSVINTPDFFARAKAYENYKVYVAYEGNQILGSTACGIKNIFINNEVKPVGYGFQAFVAPEYRRKGIASQLHQIREEYAAKQGAVLFYTLVLEKNTPAIKYIEHRGYNLHRIFAMPGLAIYKKTATNSNKTMRFAQKQDVPEIAQLLNETWQEFDFYEPKTDEQLLQFINRTPGYSFDNILILEEGGKILALLGYLDWRKVMQVTVIEMNLKMHAMRLLLKIAGSVMNVPNFIKPGDTLNQIMITLIGYKDLEYFSLLLRHLNNIALREKVEQIFFVCEQNNMMLKKLKGFIKINTAVSLYVKKLQQGQLIADTPVFVDGIDM